MSDFFYRCQLFSVEIFWFFFIVWASWHKKTSTRMGLYTIGTFKLDRIFGAGYSHKTGKICNFYERSKQDQNPVQPSLISCFSIINFIFYRYFCKSVRNWKAGKRHSAKYWTLLRSQLASSVPQISMHFFSHWQATEWLTFNDVLNHLMCTEAGSILCRCCNAATIRAAVFSNGKNLCGRPWHICDLLASVKFACMPDNK